MSAAVGEQVIHHDLRGPSRIIGEISITLRMPENRDRGVNGMAYQLDLAQNGPFKSVGYLSRDRDYPKGETSESVFDRLASLAMQPLYCCAGHHDCDLGWCGSGLPHPELKWRGVTIPRWCSTDILVPDKTSVYIAPALILHYIRVHRYLPSAYFINAALACPEPTSDEYRSEIRRIVPNIPFC